MVKEHLHIVYKHIMVSGLDYVQKRNNASVKSVNNAQMRLHVQAIAGVLGGMTQTRYRTNMLKRKHTNTLLCYDANALSD